MRHSATVTTKAEFLQIIEAYAKTLEHSASFPAECDIDEQGKDGAYSLHITVHFPLQKRSVRKDVRHGR